MWNIHLLHDNKKVKVVPPFICNYQQPHLPDYTPLHLKDNSSIIGLIFLDLGLLKPIQDIYFKKTYLDNYLQLFDKRYGSQLTMIIKKLLDGCPL